MDPLFYWFNFFWLVAFFAVLVGMSGYGFHRFMLLFLYFKHRKDKPQPKEQLEEWPLVTIQLPMFNERTVVEGLLEKVCAIDYPKDKLEIQILDDSTDETTALCEQLVTKYRAEGFDVVLLHREDRTGFKSGAMEAATEVAKGEYLLILDADFRPDPDILKVCMPFFTDSKVALVQTRWGHINRNKNLLTRLQSIFLDGHFALEQGVRNRSGRYFTFNGTGGVWRKCAIADGGGWSHDTITEDMDLSYRVQMKGWNFVYLNDYVCNAYLPEDMESFKSQQHRWTKGGIQVCQKMLWPIWRSKAPLKAKLEATTHLTCNYSYLALILLCLLVIPISLNYVAPMGAWSWYSTRMMVITATLFCFATLSVCFFYVAAELIIRPRRWYMVFAYLIPLLALGMGMVINNAKAVLEAMLGHKSDFVRTPNPGDVSLDAPVANAQSKKFKLIKSFIVPVLELCFALFFTYIEVSKLLIGDFRGFFFMLPFMGFYYTGGCSLARLIARMREQKALIKAQTQS